MLWDTQDDDDDDGNDDQDLLCTMYQAYVNCIACIYQNSQYQCYEILYYQLQIKIVGCPQNSEQYLCKDFSKPDPGRAVFQENRTYPIKINTFSFVYFTNEIL